ncbi:MAG TPA: rhodanese-like domain-containing protein [Kofleriaceae bacterium]|nr:rhodanese-like domain-containing protein [Kofleriaceae bacterium]
MRLVLVAVLLFGGCSKSEPQQSPPAPAAKTKDPATARNLIASGAVVIDVRTPDEYAADHLPNATNIPVEDVSARLSEIEALVSGNKAKPIVVYCAAGGRAAKAKATLDGAGFSHVVNGGGLDDLQ